MKICSDLCMKKDSEYRIWYFPFYGRAECMRLILTHAGCKFEDIGIPQSIWPDCKSSLPGGGLPQLESKDGTLRGGSTRATARFLGMKYGYYPENPE